MDSSTEPSMERAPAGEFVGVVAGQSDEHNAAVRIQSQYRGYTSRKEAKAKRKAQIKVELQVQENQVASKDSDAKKTEGAATTDEHSAAVRIQSQYRGYNARKTHKKHNKTHAGKNIKHDVVAGATPDALKKVPLAIFDVVPEDTFIAPALDFMTLNSSTLEPTWSICKQKLESTINKWTLSPNWKYCLKLRTQNGQTFHVTAIFSAPTRRRPIPIATASVEFKVQLMQGQEDIMEYTMETQRLVHRCSTTCFQEEWLYDIIKSKEKVAELVPILRV